jgi:hypothetical protein
VIRRANLILLALALAIIVYVAGCTDAGQESAASSSEPSTPTTVVRTPIDVLIPDQGDAYPVYSQCDGHGHRVFASRHPERFVVITDPSCPGGEQR